jgi:hypothetical protein
VAVAQKIMELRFEGVCCHAGLPKHKKGEVAGDISSFVPKTLLILSVSEIGGGGLYIGATLFVTQTTQKSEGKFAAQSGFWKKYCFQHTAVIRIQI